MRKKQRSEAEFSIHFTLQTLMTEQSEKLHGVFISFMVWIRQSIGIQESIRSPARFLRLFAGISEVEMNER